MENLPSADVTHEEMNTWLDAAIEAALERVGTYGKEGMRPLMITREFYVDGDQLIWDDENRAELIGYNQEHRFEIMQMIGYNLAIAGHCIRALFMINSAWMAPIGEDPELIEAAKRGEISAKDQQGKRPALVTMGMSINGLTALAFVFTDQTPPELMRVPSGGEVPDFFSDLLVDFYEGYRQGMIQVVEENPNAGQPAEEHEENDPIRTAPPANRGKAKTNGVA